MDEALRCVFVASGETHAQQIRMFLEASGIRSIERGESLRNTHGLTLNDLGSVEILVSEDDAAMAESLIQSAESGLFRIDEAPDE